MKSLFGHSDWRPCLFALSGFAIGSIAWVGTPLALPCVLVLALLLPLVQNRREQLYLIGMYFAGATFPVLFGAMTFFGDHALPVHSLALWAGFVVALTVPYLIIKPFGPLPVFIGLPVAIAISVLLPTGIASPLTCAGVLFPATRWVGLLMTLLAFALLPVFPRLTAIGIIILSITIHAISQAPAAPLYQWSGQDTKLAGSSSPRQSPMKQYQDALTIQNSALSSRSSITVFPETVVQRWTSATDLMWKDTFKSLEARNHTVVFGALVLTSRESVQHNVLLVRGADTGSFEQRVPLPIAMWNPLGKVSVPLRIFGPSTLKLRNYTVAPLICYEQLLVAPILLSEVHHPDIIVAVANDYWSRGTNIPAIQHSASWAWAQLFHQPLVEATNL